MAQPLFPKSLEIDEDSLDELQSMLTDAGNDLQSSLNTLNGHSINRAQIIAVRQQVQARLQQLGSDIGVWVSVEVPTAYVAGQQNAARQESSFGAKESAGLILGAIAYGAYAKYANDRIMTTAKIISPSPAIFDLQNQSVDTIMKDMSTSFGNTLTYMSRSTDGIISSVQALGIRRAIAEEAKAGSSVSSISKQIASTIEDSGIYGLVDKGGHTWTPENYADMLVRTKLSEAYNNGLINSLLGIGEDLVEVSAHGATDACARWEGKILSISGNSKYYDSLQEAKNDGLFHPRCLHVLSAVPPNTYPEQNLADRELVAV